MADLRSVDRERLKPILERLLPGAKIRDTDLGFAVEAELEGDSAKDLNRDLLSNLRRAERRTTLRTQWTSNRGTDRFFDYVLKSSSKR